ncbi:hypothetical protein BLA29_013222, partial [Euroglyphus maynei]
EPENITLPPTFGQQLGSIDPEFSKPSLPIQSNVDSPKEESLIAVAKPSNASVKTRLIKTKTFSRSPPRPPVTRYKISKKKPKTKVKNNSIMKAKIPMTSTTPISSKSESNKLIKSSPIIDGKSSSMTTPCDYDVGTQSV